MSSLKLMFPGWRKLNCKGLAARSIIYACVREYSALTYPIACKLQYRSANVLTSERASMMPGCSSDPYSSMPRRALQNCRLQIAIATRTQRARPSTVMFIIISVATCICKIYCRIFVEGVHVHLQAHTEGEAEVGMTE